MIPIVDAVTDAVRVRLRPIMMSMVTTVAGLSPLVFNPGAGTELYRGVGVIVMFGLLGTAVKKAVDTAKSAVSAVGSAVNKVKDAVSNVADKLNPFN